MKFSRLNPWLVGWISLVVVVVCVNITMITLSVTSSPGLVTEDYYQHGRNFEERGLPDKQWQLTLSHSAEIHLGQPLTLTLEARQGDYTLAGADAVLYFYRPSDKDLDFSQPMTEIAAGRYSGQVTFEQLGVWDMIVELKQDEYQQSQAKRLFVKAAPNAP